MSLPISGFTAVPNPQMLAFMGAQSFIMMYQAGEGWQYGKRKISAMSNEEFNKLTPELVLEKQAVVLQNALGTIEKSMNSMTPMIGTIVEQYGDFIREIIAHIPKALQNVVGGSGTVFEGSSGFEVPPYTGKLRTGKSSVAGFIGGITTVGQLYGIDTKKEIQKSLEVHEGHQHEKVIEKKVDKPIFTIQKGNKNKLRFFYQGKVDYWSKQRQNVYKKFTILRSQMIEIKKVMDNNRSNERYVRILNAQYRAKAGQMKNVVSEVQRFDREVVKYRTQLRLLKESS